MADLPKRKPNRLQGYDYSQGGAYFVTICCKDKLPLLGRFVGGDAIAPQLLLTPWGTLCQNYLLRIPGLEASVVMPNHIHMIVCLPHTQAANTKQSLPQLIKSFKILVTKDVGSPLFQRSYYEHVIRSEADALRIRQYIDENPYKWSEDRFYCLTP